jgi:hypothetical protein
MALQKFNLSKDDFLKEVSKVKVNDVFLVSRLDYKLWVIFFEKYPEYKKTMYIPEKVKAERIYLRQIFSWEEYLYILMESQDYNEFSKRANYVFLARTWKLEILNGDYKNKKKYNDYIFSLKKYNHLIWDIDALRGCKGCKKKTIGCYIRAFVNVFILYPIWYYYKIVLYFFFIILCIIIFLYNTSFSSVYFAYQFGFFFVFLWGLCRFLEFKYSVNLYHNEVYDIYPKIVSIDFSEKNIYEKHRIFN